MPGIQKILLVEDEPYVRDIYVSTLQKAGYQVEQAINGKEALVKAKSGAPDLILLDIMIPGIDGLEVLRRLKSDQDYQHVTAVVVMITNLGGSDTEDEARKLGADGYIVKADVTPQNLVSIVKSYNSVV